MRFDYAYVAPPTLPASSRFSFALAFNPFSSRVRIVEAPRIEPVFPAFRRRYQGLEPITRVKLVNQDDRPHQAVLSLHVPGLMDAPVEKQIVLRPKEIREVAVDTVVFAEGIVGLTEPRLAQAQLKVSYSTEQGTRSHQRRAPLFVYGRNSTQWDDVGKAAAFITSTDPLVEGFARPVLAAFEADIESLGKGVANLLRAMALFEALRRHGVRYVADPNSPYAEKAADRAAVDDIQFPAELLHSRTGDCDDLTVLFCALLESAGIATALVDFPGHIFMAFDSGVSRYQLEHLPLAEHRYLVWGDRVWIPVEVTLLDRPFIQAWDSGAEELGQLARPQIRQRLVETAQAWRQYAPAGPVFDWEIAPPVRASFEADFAAQQLELESQFDAFIQNTYLDPLENPPEDVELRFVLARLYAALHRYDQALDQYRRIEGGDRAGVRNNMGIIYFLQGDPERAAAHFEEAAALRPEDREIRRNLDRALRALGRPGRLAEAVPARGEEPGKAAADNLDVDSFYWAE